MNKCAFLHVCVHARVCVTMVTSAPYIFLSKQQGASDCHTSLSVATQCVCVCVSDLVMNQPLNASLLCSKHKHMTHTTRHTYTDVYVL